MSSFPKILHHVSDDEIPLASSSLSPWVVGPTSNTPGLDSADLRSDAGRVLGMEIRPGHGTGHSQQDAGSSAVGAPEPPARAMSRTGSAWSREPPAPRVLLLLVARCLAERNQQFLNLYFCLLFATYMRPSEGPALRGFQLLPPIKGIP